MKNLRMSRYVKEYGREMLSMDEVVNLIKNDLPTKKACEVIRSGVLSEDMKTEYKEHLPSIMFNSVTGESRTLGCIERLTGLVALDIDQEGTDFRKLREKVLADGVMKPVLAFTSASGKLKMVLNAPQILQAEGEPAEVFKYYFAQCCIYMVEKYGVMPDTQCEDAVHLQFLGHDPEPWYDPSMPPTGIPFLPQGRPEVMETYGFYKSDRKGGVRDYGDAAGFDPQRYSEWLDSVRDNLVTGEDGDYVYDRAKKVKIGSRSAGTATVWVGGYGGYSLKFRLSTVAMFLYRNDCRAAQAMIENCFEDALDPAHPWNRCSPSHARLSPNREVLTWFLHEFGFTSTYELPVTTVSFTEEFRPGKGAGRDATIASKWESISRDHCMPKMLDLLMGDPTAAPEYLDIRLYSMLATASGMARNTYVRYNRKWSAPNLILNVVGSSASGKGEMSSTANMLLSPLNKAAAKWNEAQKKEYLKAKARWTHSRPSTTVDGSWSEMPDPPERPITIKYSIPVGTSNGVLNAIAENNAKMVLMNTEYSNLVLAEKSAYGGLLSQLKNIYDNDEIGGVSAKDWMDMSCVTVRHPATGALLSGVFNDFRALYRSYDDGMLARSIYYIVPEKDYSLVPLWSDDDNRYSEVARMFTMWHIWRHFSPGVGYTLSDKDFERMRREMNAFVNSMSEKYDDGGMIGGACVSLIRRFPHNVMKTACLLQSMDDFERFHLPDFGGTAAEYIAEPVITDRDIVTGKIMSETRRTYADYAAELERDFSYLGGEAERADRKRDTEPCEPRIITSMAYNWIEAAWKILMPSLIYGLRMISMYKKEETSVPGVNPLRSHVKYVALGMCPVRFRTKDYAAALVKAKGGKPSDMTVNKYLKQLFVEGKIVRTGYGRFEQTEYTGKIKDGSSAGNEPETVKNEEFDNALEVEFEG